MFEKAPETELEEAEMTQSAFMEGKLRSNELNRFNITTDGTVIAYPPI
jgi:hypothetical protein